jgi:hypothetical protein
MESRADLAPRTRSCLGGYRKFSPRRAYQTDGLLSILFDEAECSLSPLDTKRLLPRNPGAEFSRVSSGRAAAALELLRYRNFVQAGTVVHNTYNHYSLLPTIEDIFGLGYLGFAGQPGGQFGQDVFPSVP